MIRINVAYTVRVLCRDSAASDPLVVTLSGCYGDDEAVLMWKMRESDVSQSVCCYSYSCH